MTVTVTKFSDLLNYGLNPEFGEDRFTFAFGSGKSDIYHGVDNLTCTTKRGHKDHGACSGKCARPGVVLGKGDPEEFVCCPDVGDFTGDDWRLFCRGQPVNTRCREHRSCANGACGHPGGHEDPKVCCITGGTYIASDRRVFCRGTKPQNKCEGNRGCSTDNCVDGVCSATPRKSVGTRIENFLFYLALGIGILLILIIIIKFS